MGTLCKFSFPVLHERVCWWQEHPVLLGCSCRQRFDPTWRWGRDTLLCCCKHVPVRWETSEGECACGSSVPLRHFPVRREAGFALQHFLLCCGGVTFVGPVYLHPCTNRLFFAVVARSGHPGLHFALCVLVSVRLPIFT